MSRNAMYAGAMPWPVRVQYVIMLKVYGKLSAQKQLQDTDQEDGTVLLCSTVQTIVQ